MPITKLELSRCGNFLASISHDNAIKFYDLSEIGKVSKGFVADLEAENKVNDMITEKKKNKPENEENDEDFEDEDSDDSDDSDEGDGEIMKEEKMQYEEIDKNVSSKNKKRVKIINQKAKNVGFFDNL